MNGGSVDRTKIISTGDCIVNINGKQAATHEPEEIINFLVKKIK